MRVSLNRSTKSAHMSSVIGGHAPMVVEDLSRISPALPFLTPGQGKWILSSDGPAGRMHPETRKDEPQPEHQDSLRSQGREARLGEVAPDRWPVTLRSWRRPGPTPWLAGRHRLKAPRARLIAGTGLVMIEHSGPSPRRSPNSHSHARKRQFHSTGRIGQ